MMLLGCSTLFKKKLNTTSNYKKHVIDIAKETGESSRHIPTIYLISCNKPVNFEDDSIESILLVIQKNMSLFRECRMRHNGLIEFIKKNHE